MYTVHDCSIKKGYFIYFKLPGNWNALTTNLLITLTDFGSPFFGQPGKEAAEDDEWQLIIISASGIFQCRPGVDGSLKCKVEDTDSYGGDGI